LLLQVKFVKRLAKEVRREHSQRLAKEVRREQSPSELR
jgi:hypothetical protein